MPAAGPESSVRIGRRSISATSITPPSLRITISGAGIAARSTAPAVIRAVRSIFGRMAALSAAVRVRDRRPYAELTSCPLVASMPRSRAYATAYDSRSGRSTPKLRLAASARVPPAIRRSTPARTDASSPALANSNAGANETPDASAIGVKCICRRAGHDKPSSSPRMPTGARSPSKSALVACVVECAMNATEPASTPARSSNCSRPAMIPVGDAARGVVRRRDLDARDEFARRRVDGDHVGERSTDVDPHAQTLRRRGCHQIKPAVATCASICIVTLPSRSYSSKSACRSRRSASARSPEAGRYEEEAARPISASRSSG